MAINQEVLNKFAQAYERSQDLVDLREDEGLALIFRDFCREERRQLQSGSTTQRTTSVDLFGNVSGTQGLPEDSLQLWRAEENTWELVHRLYFQRLTASSGEEEPARQSDPFVRRSNQTSTMEDDNSVMGDDQQPTANVLDTAHSLIQRLFREDGQLAENNIVRTWLENIAPPFHPEPPRKGDWKYTRNALRNWQRGQQGKNSGMGADGGPSQLTQSGLGSHKLDTLWPSSASQTSLERARSGLSSAFSGTQPEEYVTSLDPDAPHREHKKLHSGDEAFERELIQTLFQFLRRGRLHEAIELCHNNGMAWRAASMRGGLFYHDPLLEVGVRSRDAVVPEDSDSENDLSHVDTYDEEAIGSLDRTRWKQACLMLSQDKALDKTERAIYSALIGALDNLLPVCETWEDYLWAYYTAIIESRVDQYLQQRSHQQELVEGIVPDGLVQEERELRALFDSNGLAPLCLSVDQVIEAGDLNPDAVFERIMHASNTQVALQATQDPYRRIQMMVILGRTSELVQQFAEQLNPQYATELEGKVLQLSCIDHSDDNTSMARVSGNVKEEVPNNDAGNSSLVSLFVQPNTNVPANLLRLMVHLVIYLRAHSILLPDLAADTIVLYYVMSLAQETHHHETILLKQCPSLSLSEDATSEESTTLSTPTTTADSPRACPAAEWVALYTSLLPRSWQVPTYARYLAGIRASFKPYRSHALHRAEKSGLDVRHCARLVTDICLAGGVLVQDARTERAQPTISDVYATVAERDQWYIRALEWLSYDKELYRTLLLRCNALARSFLCTGKLHCVRQLLNKVPNDLILPGWIDAVKRLDEGKDLGLDHPVVEDTGMGDVDMDMDTERVSHSSEELFDWQLGWDEKTPTDMGLDESTGPSYNPRERANHLKRELLAGVQEFFHYKNLVDCFEAYDAWAECLVRKPEAGDTTIGSMSRGLSGQKSHKVHMAEWRVRFKKCTLKAEETLRRLLELDWLSSDIHSSGVTRQDEMRNYDLEYLRQWFIPEVVFRLHSVLYESSDVLDNSLNKSLQLCHLVADERYQLYREFVKTRQLPRLLELMSQSSMGILHKGSPNPFHTEI
ncbi:Nucleoporin nup84 [Dispira parvispora]|uniref:Nuclear pore complex protein n=1 Tax=Dispira parvispora TaxID=1520584 RepID=A0A9W8AXP3_9FUNG|nr:Nucleoporin nup84 [Dispira parvispora]